MKKIYKYLVPIGITLLGLFFAIYSSTHYQLFSPTQGPMQGAIPTILGVLLTVAGLATIFQAKNQEVPPFNYKNWTIIIAVGLIIILSYIIGFIPSVFILMFIWMRVIEKLSWKTSIIVNAILLIFVLVVFCFWMKIPFTEGLVYETLFD